MVLVLSCMWTVYSSRSLPTTCSSIKGRPQIFSLTFWDDTGTETKQLSYARNLLPWTFKGFEQACQTHYFSLAWFTAQWCFVGKSQYKCRFILIWFKVININKLGLSREVKDPSENVQNTFRTFTLRFTVFTHRGTKTCSVYEFRSGLWTLCLMFDTPGAHF